MPQHQWDGTRLRFQQSLDVWGQWVDLRGPAGEKGLTQAYYGAVDPAGGGGIGEAPIDGSPYWRKDGAWALAITGGSATWGAIGGNIADQTDLKTALDAKAATSSLATVATTGAYSDLTGKPTLGTAAAAATTDFATAAQGATADAAEPAAHAAATYATITNLALKAPLASPTFTGTVTIPTPSGGDNSTKAASTAFVVAGFAPIANPTFTGTPAGPTAAVGTDTTQFASTAFVQAAVTAIGVTSKSADYTLVLADKGSAIYHPSTDANGRTFTIPANSSVAYAVGTTLTFVNMSANALSIAITSDTMNLAGAGSTGTRTLAQYGTATAVKLASTLWLISGVNLT